MNQAIPRRISRVVQAFAVMAGLFLLFHTCASKKYAIERLPETYILFGEGGGFANLLESNYLLPNGQILRSRSLGDQPPAIESISPRSAKVWFRRLEQSDFLSTELNEPDNIYHFIALVENGEEIHRITWGFDDIILPEQMREVKRDLWKLVETVE